MVMACAAYRAPDEKRVLCQHTMSARSRTAAGPRERGRSSLLREPSLPNNPLHNRTRTRSFCLFFVPSVCAVGNVCHASNPRFFCLSQEVCVTAFTVRQLSMQTLAFAPSTVHGDPVVSQDTLKFHSDSPSRKPHDFFWLHHICAVVAPHRRAAARNCQDTRILTSQRPPCMCALFCRATSLVVLARSFVCHSTQFLHASSITADENRNFQHLFYIDRRQLQLSRRRCTAARQAL